MSATRSAVIRSAGLLGVKIAAYLVTGSAVLLAGLVDSIVDVIASLIAYIIKPREHHAEHQLALIQSFWIVAGGLIVIIESIRGFHEPVEQASIGIAILVFTVIVDTSIVRKLRKDHSPVVQGLAADIQADIMNALGGLVALTIIALGAPMLMDKVIAIIISIALIVKGARMFFEHMEEATEDHAAEHVHEEEGTYLNTLAP